MSFVVDKQINSQESSNYWIAEFLDSDLRTTAAAGKSPPRGRACIPAEAGKTV
jgi:hypothetical protein